MDAFGTVIERHLRSLTGMLGEVSVAQAAGVVSGLSYDDVVGVIERTTGIIREAEALRTVAAGVAAALSSREAGHGGLAQTRGHRSVTSLIQDLTGVSRHQAGKVTRLGQSLLEVAATGDADLGAGPGEVPEPVEGPSADPDAAPPVPSRPWHACLEDAYTARRISLDQQTAIRDGLGEPVAAPAGADGLAALTPDPAGAAVSADEPTAEAMADACAAWAAAAEQLIEEAAHRTVEDLAAAARVIRDTLDPEGAKRRFEQQFEGRSIRRWTDRNGIKHAHIQFEPGGAALFDSIVDSAMRPRRGGPRFIDPDEKAAADALIADPRTNQQLEYDLVVGVIHAGALADAATVFGARQAGLRIIETATARDAERAGRAAVAIIEDTNVTVPAAFAAQHACNTGTVTITVDGTGNPLNLGRDARLFSPKQRLVMAVRDGGCGWAGCDRPASYCEAHHIDPYSQGGRTDVDRGILLCRFHHMNLHHNGWWITRDGAGPFVLHSPDPHTPPIVLQPRLERRYLFGDLQPPPTRFRPAA